jgi:hypothetical protein
MPNFYLSLFFFFVSRSALHLNPDQSLIRDDRGEKGECITAFKGGHNNYSMLYLPVGKKIAVNPSSINAERIKTSRFNPKMVKSHDKGFTRERQ